MIYVYEVFICKLRTHDRMKIPPSCKEAALSLTLASTEPLKLSVLVTAWPALACI